MINNFFRRVKVQIMEWPSKFVQVFLLFQSKSGNSYHQQILRSKYMKPVYFISKNKLKSVKMNPEYHRISIKKL